MRLREAGMDDNHIGRFVELFASIAVNDLNVAIEAKVVRSTCRKPLVAFDGEHPALWTYDLRQDRGEIAEAAADLHDAVFLPDVEHVDEMRPQAREASVELAARVDRHQDIVIEANGIGVRRQPIAPQRLALDAPRTFRQKILARDGRERCEQARRGYPLPPRDQLHVARTRGGKIAHFTGSAR